MMIFPDIGIYGFKSDIEDAVLTGFLTGDPMLLIGPQGTAKTGLVDATGYAFREYSKRRQLTDPSVKLYEFRTYDSSKMNFEDLNGFPNPKAMQEGRTEFIPSKTTAWGADQICFDEFNRQEPARQNNIFELVRSRRLMGTPTGTYWIINCMNPYGMAGTEELDEALVDRNAIFIHVPSFTELNDSAKNAIIRHMGGNDGPGLRYWQKKTLEWDVVDTGKINEKFADAGEKLTRLLSLAAEKYTLLENEVGSAYSRFVDKYVCLLSAEMEGKDWKVQLSGRRAGMIYRVLLGFRAIDLAKADMDGHHTVRDLKESFRTVLRMSIPVGISTATAGMHEAAGAHISNLVDTFADFFKDTKHAKTSIDVIYELLTTKNFVRKIQILINDVKDDVAKNQVWNSIIKSNKDMKTADGMRNMVTLGIITHLMTVKPEAIPQALQSQIAVEAKSLLSLDKLNTSITLQGPLAFYSKEIESSVEHRCKNIFSKLQAKLLYESEAGKFRLSDELSDHEFNNIRDNIIKECDILERTVKEQGLLISKPEVEIGI